MSDPKENSPKERDITIRIHKTTMKLGVPVDNESVEQHLRAAATMVNSLVAKYQSTYPEESTEDLLAYVALHCARDYYVLHDSESSRQIEQRLADLLKTIEDALR